MIELRNIIKRLVGHFCLCPDHRKRLTPVWVRSVSSRVGMLLVLCAGINLVSQPTLAQTKRTTQQAKPIKVTKPAGQEPAAISTEPQEDGTQVVIPPTGAEVLAKRSKGEQDSVHAVVKQLLKQITGPLGYKRDWEAVRQLFVPEAIMMVNGAKGVKVMPASTFWLQGDSLYGKIAFQEAESSFNCQVSGTIASVQQGYHCAVNNKPSHYGHNVYTLIKRPEGKWLISHLAWYQLPLK